MPKKMSKSKPKPQLEALTQRLNEVLRYYADADNYKAKPSGYTLVMPIEDDNGSRARACLAEVIAWAEAQDTAQSKREQEDK